MHRRVDNKVKDKRKLYNMHTFLQALNGETFKLDVCVDVTFEIRGFKLRHYFL